MDATRRNEKQHEESDSDEVYSPRQATLFGSHCVDFLELHSSVRLDLTERKTCSCVSIERAWCCACVRVCSGGGRGRVRQSSSEFERVRERMSVCTVECCAECAITICFIMIPSLPPSTISLHRGALVWVGHMCESRTALGGANPAVSPRSLLHHSGRFGHERALRADEHGTRERYNLHSLCTRVCVCVCVASVLCAVFLCPIDSAL
jgi:hypothetical protein